MTSTSKNTAAIELVFPKRRGRPTGVKNGQGVKKKTVKKPRVRINTEAIVANGELKKAKAEIDSLNREVISMKLHIDKVEGQHKAALIVIGYLERKLFTE